MIREKEMVGVGDWGGQQEGSSYIGRCHFDRSPGRCRPWWVGEITREEKKEKRRTLPEAGIIRLRDCTN